jgi:hypothetical protein
MPTCYYLLTFYVSVDRNILRCFSDDKEAGTCVSNRILVTVFLFVSNDREFVVVRLLLNSFLFMLVALLVTLNTEWIRCYTLLQLLCTFR